MNQLTDDVDKTIMDEVAEARAEGNNVDYVETRDAFYGHSVECIDDPNATNSSWVNGLIFGNPGVYAKASPLSFHPNALGQSAFAKLINAAR